MSRKTTGQRALDLNLLPQRYRPRRITLKDTLPWVLALILTATVFPVSKLFVTTTARLAILETEYDRLQAELEAYDPMLEEAAALEDGITSAELTIDSIQGAYSEITIQNIVWGEVLGQIVRLQPEGVELLVLDQSGDQLAISGQAQTYRSPLQFLEAILQSPGFLAGEVEAIFRLTPAEVEANPDSETESESPPVEPEPGYGFEILLQVEGGGNP
jgi:Tfp pilus assembly protein PilN